MGLALCCIGSMFCRCVAGLGRLRRERVVVADGLKAAKNDWARIRYDFRKAYFRDHPDYQPQRDCPKLCKAYDEAQPGDPSGGIASSHFSNAKYKIERGR